MGSPHETATHDVHDPGFGDEEVDSDQRLVEQWNDAEATYGICRPGVNDDAVYTGKPQKGLLLPRTLGS